MYQERQRGGYRRSKERFVWEAMECVQRWRDIFENGLNDEGGNLRRYTLVQAAEIVQIPKKTLEDYYSIIRKASQIIDLKRVLDKKMGYLRNLIKQYKNTGAVQTLLSTNDLEMKEDEMQEEKIVQNELAECYHNENDWNDMIIEEQEEEQPVLGFTQCEVNDDFDQYFWEEDELQPDNLFFPQRARSHSRNSAGIYEVDHFQQEEQEEAFNPAVPDI